MRQPQTTKLDSFNQLLATGELSRFAFADWKAHEIPLARQLIEWIQPKEIVLADRAFCGWGFIALLQRKGVDVVLRLHQARRTTEGRVCWAKPQRKTETWTKALWAELPDELSLRVVTFRVAVKGFRTKVVTVVTTLLDENQYPGEASRNSIASAGRLNFSFVRSKRHWAWTCCAASPPT